MIPVSVASDNEYLTSSIIVSFFYDHQMCCLFYSVPQFGRTALMSASLRGHTDVVQLLSSGAQVDLQDEVRHNMLKGTPELRIDTMVN